MGFPLIPVGNGAYVGTVASHIPPYSERHKVTINNTHSSDLVINELADYGDGYTTFPANTTTSYYYDIDEGSEVDEIIEDAIQGYTTRYIFTSEDEYYVDETKFCYVGGIIQVAGQGQATTGLRGPVLFGYANTNDPTDPNFDFVTVLQHQGGFAYQPDGYQQYEMKLGADIRGNALSSNPETQFRVCVDTHGHDAYDTTAQSYLRNKLASDLGHPLTLDDDVGNLSQSGWYGTNYQGVRSAINDTAIQRIFSLALRPVVLPQPFSVSGSVMLKDRYIIEAMQNGYVYPYVNIASQDGTIPSGYDASYVIDEEEPEGDWGWVAEMPDFSNLMEVNVDGRWKGVKSAKVYVNGQWKDVVDYKVYQNGQWKHGSASTQIGLY